MHSDTLGVRWMEPIDLHLVFADVPAEGLQLVEDTHAEWLRLSEAERAHAHAAADEAAAHQRQHGARPGHRG